MKVEKYKGTRDLSPQEMADFRRIEAIFRDCCLKYGYREVRTPTIEYLHLFTSAGTLTPGMLGKVYSFLDWDGWSGERVVLRPDGTIPVARYYIDNLKDLARLFYVANMFIFDETGKKNRERWQLGVELIGAGSPVADTELISLSLNVLKNLGISGVDLKLSHAGLIKALLRKLGLSADEQHRVFDRMLDGDTAALSGVKLSNPQLAETVLSLLRMKGQSAGFLRNLRAQFAGELREAQPYIDDFIRVADFLEMLGCGYQIDITSGAGFEYYTGLVFQLFNGEDKLGGGGRYDDLIPAMSGKGVPASGFALYLDRLMSLAGKPVADKKEKRVLIRAMFDESDALQKTFELAGNLRDAGYIAELALDGQSLASFDWVVDVRDNPLRFSAENQATGKQTEVKSAGGLLKILEADSAGKNRAA
ncbi:MAG: HisS family protein [Dehalococcoidales bacterium]|nr:HisS family protein [Dehalococcoidales bacterium]